MESEGEGLTRITTTIETATGTTTHTTVATGSVMTVTTSAPPLGQSNVAESLADMVCSNNIVKQACRFVDDPGNEAHILVPVHATPISALTHIIPSSIPRYLAARGYCSSCSVMSVANIWQEFLESEIFLDELMICGLAEEEAVTVNKLFNAGGPMLYF